MTDANVLLKWLRYERIDGVPDEERRRQCATLIEQQAREIERFKHAIRDFFDMMSDGPDESDVAMVVGNLKAALHESQP